MVALHAITCSVERSSRIALMGRSGSGKSTLLQLMAGLDHSTSGTVEWPLWNESPFGHPDRVGMVFQEASLIPGLSALDNAAFPLLIKGVAYEEATARAAEAMALLGIEGVSRQSPDELSGGQAQRVAVARVITVEPDLILADEPTGKLDRATGAGVIDLLLEASAHVGAGLVVSTHDREVASRMNEIWSLHDGELDAGR